MSSIAAQTYLTPEEYIANVLPFFSIEAEPSLRQIYRFVEFETDADLQTTVGAGGFSLGID